MKKIGWIEWTIKRNQTKQEPIQYNNATTKGEKKKRKKKKNPKKTTIKLGMIKLDFNLVYSGL